MQNAEKKQKKEKRRGRLPKAPEDRRDHCVSVRLNAAELAKLDEARGEFQRGEMMRFAFLGTTPPAAPAELNLRTWRELARAQANLNQLARAVNSSAAVEIKEVLEQVVAFRNALIGVQL